MKYIFWLGGIILAITSLMVIAAQNDKINQFEVQSFQLNKKRYELEIAQSRPQLRQGLMGRSKLENNKGMLFKFPFEGEHGIWMKNTLIPLTVAWLDSSYKVIGVKKLTPCHTASCPIFSINQFSSYVLELNIDNDIKVNDQLYSLP
ncbi:MAG: DUF192 domain-containing protein [Gammaproteobacteria bacterium]|nr:DUF192 domain-containing protein [Gammaproteobacteria bacterium]